MTEQNGPGTSWTSHTAGMITIQMRQQPGNSEHKIIYLSKAALFRKYRANSCPTEVDGHNFDWLQKVQKFTHSWCFTLFSHKVCLPCRLQQYSYLIPVTFFFFPEKDSHSFQNRVQVMAFKRYNFSCYASQTFNTKTHQKSNLTH